MCVGSGGQVTERMGLEPLRSSSPSQEGSSGQSAAVGDFLPPGVLSVSRSLPSRKEFLSVACSSTSTKRGMKRKESKEETGWVASCAHTCCAEVWPPG